MEEKKIRLLDSQFAAFLAGRSRLTGQDRKQFQGIICRLSMGLAAGDTCLPLTESEASLIVASGLSGDGDQPLCVHGRLLYTKRYFCHERNLGQNICALLQQSTTLEVDGRLLDHLFPVENEEEIDWQRLAAERALQHHFFIVSGGPGTGKSTTVVKILALLQSVTGQQLRIALAAPTGKAANRLQEAVNSSVGKLAVSEKIKESIPQSASTLHRLLGVRRHSPFFRHNSQNPLLFDLVLIDEASMVDLALMAKLVDALKPGSRLILLGDKDQLASVESGTVLGDMIASLPENTVELQKTYRFDAGIKCFAHAINTGNAMEAWTLLRGDSPNNVTLLDGGASEYGGKMYCEYMAAVRRAIHLEDYKKLFQVFHSFKILCALRHGPTGVSGLNAAVEKYLSQNGHDCFGDTWYPGRPVMVSRNEYSLDLYNGDMGICLPDPENPSSMKIWFEQIDGSLQGVLPGRIGACETAYALTIHKSQGTEVGEVLVVLPEKESTLVSRELLYTAVTRARHTVKLSSSRRVFDCAVLEKIQRHSGLGTEMALWSGGMGRRVNVK